jgi:hypothetical protein
MPPAKDPHLELSVALREVTGRLEHLQVDVSQLEEARKVIAKMERILARMEVQIDNITERHERDIEAVKEELRRTSDGLDKAIKAAEASLTVDVEEMKKKISVIEKAHKDNVDKVEERRLSSKKLWIGSAVTIIVSLVTAITAIAVAYLKEPATPEEPPPAPVSRDAGALLQDGSSSTRATYRRAAQDRSQPDSPRAVSTAASTP